jgi:hypothetical protein
MEQFNWYVLIWLVPLLVGAIVAAANKDPVNDVTERIESRFRDWKSRVASRDGFLFRWVLNPLLWTIVKFFDWTDGFSHRGLKNGVRVATTLYLIALWLLLLYSAIVIAVMVAMVLLGLFIVGKILSASSDSGSSSYSYSNADDDDDSRNVRPRGGRSVRKTDWLGEEYVERTDEDGNVVSRSRVREGLFSGKYVETSGADGKVVARTESREGLLGERFMETRDSDGAVTSRTREKEGWLGDRYSETEDAHGEVVEESRRTEGLFGGPYTEHKSRKD